MGEALLDALAWQVQCLNPKANLCKKGPNLYEVRGRIVQLDVASAANGLPGLVVVDGPLRQPLTDYLAGSSQNEAWPVVPVVQSALHELPQARRVSFEEVFPETRAEAMEVAVMEAQAREQHAKEQLVVEPSSPKAGVREATAPPLLQPVALLGPVGLPGCVSMAGRPMLPGFAPLVGPPTPPPPPAGMLTPPLLPEPMVQLASKALAPTLMFSPSLDRSPSASFPLAGARCVSLSRSPSRGSARMSCSPSPSAAALRHPRPHAGCRYRAPPQCVPLGRSSTPLGQACVRTPSIGSTCMPRTPTMAFRESVTPAPPRSRPVSPMHGSVPTLRSALPPTPTMRARELSPAQPRQQGRSPSPRAPSCMHWDFQQDARASNASAPVLRHVQSFPSSRAFDTPGKALCSRTNVGDVARSGTPLLTSGDSRRSPRPFPRSTSLPATSPGEPPRSVAVPDIACNRMFSDVLNSTAISSSRTLFLDDQADNRHAAIPARHVPQPRNREREVLTIPPPPTWPTLELNDSRLMNHPADGVHRRSVAWEGATSNDSQSHCHSVAGDMTGGTGDSVGGSHGSSELPAQSLSAWARRRNHAVSNPLMSVRADGGSETGVECSPHPDQSAYAPIGRTSAASTEMIARGYREMCQSGLVSKMEGSQTLFVDVFPGPMQANVIGGRGNANSLDRLGDLRGAFASLRAEVGTLHLQLDAAKASAAREIAHKDAKVSTLIDRTKAVRRLLDEAWVERSQQATAIHEMEQLLAEKSGRQLLLPEH